jgi:hypothetical protein
MTILTKRIQRNVAGLLVGGVFIFIAGQAQALSIKNPENCQGPVTIGVATCPDKPGHWVECNNLGDYMCCVQNDQGGKDCEQIENKTSNPMGGVKGFQGGVLQNPTMKPSPNTSRFPKTGAKSSIRGRGIEGEQISEPSSEVLEQKDIPGETSK